MVPIRLRRQAAKGLDVNSDGAGGSEDAGQVPFDLFQQLTDLAVPQPTYQALLANGPLACPADGVAVALSREAVEQTLQNHEIFSAANIVQLGNVRPLIPLSVDPPEHKKYRRILDPLFAPKKMEALEGDIAARFNRLMDAFVDDGRCDFTKEVAVPFPSSIFCGLMGLPYEEIDVLLGLANGILRPGGETGTTPEESARVQRETGQEIYRYFDAILDDRAAHPREDILSHFLAAEIDGEHLTREEILDICFLFLIAGLDTVTDSLTCFFAHLARHPEHRRELIEDESVIPSAVEELLRWETPVTQTPRLATADTTVAGCPISAGTLMVVQFGAANVDTDELPDAMDVRFDRDVNRHLSFGGGVHRCLGSHLARRELRVALREWHRRIPDYELEPGLELNFPPGLRTVSNLRLVW
jgi:cytochrome P450